MEKSECETFRFFGNAGRDNAIQQWFLPQQNSVKSLQLAGCLEVTRKPHSFKGEVVLVLLVGATVKDKDKLKPKVKVLGGSPVKDSDIFGAKVGFKRSVGRSTGSTGGDLGQSCFDGGSQLRWQTSTVLRCRKTTALRCRTIEIPLELDESGFG